jgi:hypothetical protein
MARKQSKDIRPGLRARMALLDHPDFTDQEIADHAKCGLRTVAYAKQKLIREGHVPVSYFDRTTKTRTLKMTERLLADPTSKLSLSVASNDTSSEHVSPEVAEIKTAQQSGTLTIEESLERYTKFARDAEAEGNFSLSKDATKAYHELEARSSETILGPPPPQTDEEKVSRTTNILDVVGPALTATAICQAFILIEDRAAFEEEFSRQSVTHPPKDDTRASTLAGDSSNAETAEGPESPPLAEGHAESSPDDDASLPFLKAPERLGRSGEDKERLRDPSGLEPDLGSSGDVDSTP